MAEEGSLADDVADLKLAFNAVRDKLHSINQVLESLSREIALLRAEADLLRLLMNKRLVRAETFSLLTSKIESYMAGLEVLRCLQERPRRR
ncbi:TPA: hypothetical protein EYP44_02450 [Candidatus Bathyarchaeota archaeon]|nr:hypothetical protein [Candidatus Bathyarchaeota archaeon]